MAHKLHRFGSLIFACIAVLIFGCAIVVADDAETFCVQVPQGLDPSKARILIIQEGKNSYGCLMTKNQVTGLYYIGIKKGNSNIKMTMYYPGYKIFSAKLKVSEISKNIPYIPVIEKLRSVPLTIRLTSSDGTPIAGKKLTLRQDAIPYNFCPAGSGLIDPMQDAVSGITNNCGIINFEVPVILDDPAIYQNDKYKPTFTIWTDDMREVMPKLVTRPEKIISQKCYDKPINILLLHAGKISGVLDKSFLKTHKLSADIINNANSNTSQFLFYAKGIDKIYDHGIGVPINSDGSFSVTLPPATYDIYIESSHKLENNTYNILFKHNFILKEGEEQRIVID